MNEERIARSCICCGQNRLGKSPAILMPFVAHRVFDQTPVRIEAEWGLRDLQSGMAYTLCSSLQCQHCGTLFLDYRFSDHEMGLLYRDYRGKAYTQLRQHYEPSYTDYSDSYCSRAHYIDDVEVLLRPYLPAHPVILDWGGDSGINTPLRHSALETYIYDISERDLVEGVQRVDPISAKLRPYDLIICSQVLEHIPYPKKLLQEMVALAQEETLLYLEVPYEALIRTQPTSLLLHASKHHWHEHINFFTKNSLREMAAQAGLDVLALTETDISLGWRDSCILSMLCRRK